MGCSLHPRSSIVLIITSIAADNISSGESSAFNGRIPEAAEVLSASLEQLPILPRRRRRAEAALVAASDRAATPGYRNRFHEGRSYLCREAW